MKYRHITDVILGIGLLFTGMFVILPQRGVVGGIGLVMCVLGAIFLVHALTKGGDAT